jgi:hypothetical protein
VELSPKRCDTRRVRASLKPAMPRVASPKLSPSDSSANGKNCVELAANLDDDTKARIDELMDPNRRNDD